MNPAAIWIIMDLLDLNPKQSRRELPEKFDRAGTLIGWALAAACWVPVWVFWWVLSAM